MKQTNRIIFRADGNSRIGLGHVIRSLALANMLQDDFECVFLIQEPDKNIIINLAEAGLKTITLPATQQYLEEAIELGKILQPSDIVVLDSYAFTTEYQQKIKNLVYKLICIDDIHAFPFVADAIINQAGGVNPEQYQAEPFTQLYLGPAYALLREPFLQAALQKRVIINVNNILLNMGGADPDNQTLNLLKSISDNHKQLNIHVVVGAAYLHLEKLLAFKQQHPAITVHQNLDAGAMCRLMQKCDAAILPPSSVSYEWCAVSGLLFVHQIAVNQQDMADFLINNNLAYPLADIVGILNQPDIAQIIDRQIKRQCEYFDGRSKLRLQRIFSALIPSDKFRLRRARTEDMQLLFDWANDPEVRSHSFNPAPIPLEMHQRWFSSKLNNPDCLIYIVLAEAVPAGMIRYDISEKQATISYLLNKNFRGKGLGSQVLRAGTEILQQHRPDIDIIIGHIHPSNMASIKSFRKAGFTQTKEIPSAAPNSLVFANSLK